MLNIIPEVRLAYEHLLQKYCDWRFRTKLRPSKHYLIKRGNIEKYATTKSFFAHNAPSHSLSRFITTPIGENIDCNRSVAVWCGFFTSITLRGFPRNEEHFPGFLQYRV